MNDQEHTDKIKEKSLAYAEKTLRDAFERYFEKVMARIHNQDSPDKDGYVYYFHKDEGISVDETRAIRVCKNAFPDDCLSLSMDVSFTKVKKDRELGDDGLWGLK